MVCSKCAASVKQYLPGLHCVGLQVIDYCQKSKVLLWLNLPHCMWANSTHISVTGVMSMVDEEVMILNQ